jgi:putative membrane protein
MAKKYVSKLGTRMGDSIARPFHTTEKIILRDYLAMQRTSLANERTLFAYIRTSLYLVLGGIGILEWDDLRAIQWVGHASLIISLLILGYGFFRYLALRAKLLKYYAIMEADTETLERVEEGNEKGGDQPKEEVQR